MKRFNIEKFINIIFILYIVVYIALFIEIYFINNGIILLVLMAIEVYLMAMELLSISYTKEKYSKLKVIIVVVLHWFKYLLLSI